MDLALAKLIKIDPRFDINVFLDNFEFVETPLGYGEIFLASTYRSWLYMLEFEIPPKKWNCLGCE